MTESPRRNLRTFSKSDTCGCGNTYNFEMKRSLLTFLPYEPFANRGVSVHISFAFSRTMLQ